MPKRDRESSALLLSIHNMRYPAGFVCTFSKALWLFILLVRRLEYAEKLE